MPHRLPVLVAVIALVAIVAAVIAAPGTSTASGVVVAVDAASLTDVRSFTLRMADGRTVEFAVGALQNEIEFSPGHLVEHITSGVPVLVTWRDEAGSPTAIRIEDAPVAPPT